MDSATNGMSMQEVAAYDLAAKAEKTAKATTPGEVVQDGGYDEFKRTFDTYVGSMQSAQGPMVDLRYLLRKKNPPATFVNEQEKRLYQVKMSGHQFDIDNKQLWVIIQRVTSGTSLYPYMQPMELTMNGRDGLLAMVDQCEGDDVVNTRVTMANRVISPEHGITWKVGQGSFATYSSELLFSYTVIKQNDEDRGQQAMVERLLSGIKTRDSMLLSVAISHTQDHYKRDFDGAVRYLKEKICSIFGVEKEVKNSRKVWEANQGGFHGGGRGRGYRGRGFGRGGRGGRGGQGGRYSGRGHRGRGNGGASKSFNGVDCTHVNRFFTQEEFDKMGDDGRSYVHNSRKRKNDGDGNHQSENKRLVQEISALRAEMKERNDDVPDEAGSKSEKGGKNGLAFGRKGK